MTRWIEFIQKHALLILVLSFILTSCILYYSVSNFRIDTDLTRMISKKIPFRKIYRQYEQAFPLHKTITVVIDGDTPEIAEYAANKLVSRLKKNKNIFSSIFHPGSGDFFRKNGLLYLEIEDLEDLADNFSKAQPLMALLAKDFTIHGFFNVFELLLRKGEEYSVMKHLDPLFNQIYMAFDGVLNDELYYISWQEMMYGHDVVKGQQRQFIILQLNKEHNASISKTETIKLVRQYAEKVQKDFPDMLTIRLTGSVVQSYEDMKSLRDGIVILSMISIILVALTLYIATGSKRMVIFSIITLITGLMWTTGFAIFFLGSLNLISVTFAILFIGLGIDYSIQTCLYYKECIIAGLDSSKALHKTLSHLFRVLLICAVTTAMGFYAFVPTVYVGASELGIIAGTGMIICFLANMIVLPSLLVRTSFRQNIKTFLTLDKSIALLPFKHSGKILAATIFLSVIALIASNYVYFDHNPINLSDPALESVSTEKELVKEAGRKAWTISVLAHSADEAKKLANRLQSLKEVDDAVNIFDMVPKQQEKKIKIIELIALFTPSIKQVESSSTLQQNLAALNKFKLALKNLFLSDNSPQYSNKSSIEKLYKIIEQFETRAKADSEWGKSAFARLEKSILFNLSYLLDKIHDLLKASPFQAEDLPEELKRRYVSSDNLYRVQVIPSESLLKFSALKDFVQAVRTIAPEATDTPVLLFETKKAVVSAFRDATITAIAIIIVLLFIQTKRIYESLLIIIPLSLSILFTLGTTVLFDIPFNFENIIVLPLLLGMGVDSGIHMVLRFRSIHNKQNILLTSTARSIFFSLLTTIVSFGSLCFSHHEGTSSMGILLTICSFYMIVTTFIVLPALLNFYKKRLIKSEA